MNYMTRSLSIRKFSYMFLLGLLLALSTAFSTLADEAVIEGLHLEKIAKGKKVYSIEAGWASVGNKRIGFFNTAMIKVFNLEDVNVTLYNDNRVVEIRHFYKAVFEINTKRLLDEEGKVIFAE